MSTEIEQPTSHQICRRLDWLAMRSLELSEDILSERVALDSEMKDAYINMAKSRYSMGNWSVGTSQLPTEQATVEPLYRVCRHDGSPFAEFHLTSTKNEDSVGETQPELRKRGKSEKKEDQNGEVEEEECKKKDKLQRDPLAWFGILVPATLKESQKGFQRSLHRLCKLATFQNELHMLSIEYKDLMESKQTFEAH